MARDSVLRRVAGHTLRCEGAPHAVNERQEVVRVWEGRHGRALCSCGWLSEMCDSTAMRQRVHAGHKVMILAQRQAEGAEHD